MEIHGNSRFDDSPKSTAVPVVVVVQKATRASIGTLYGPWPGIAVKTQKWHEMAQSSK